MQSNTVAAILGGGAGLRMGGRKALVALDGAPLAEHVARALRPASGALAMVGDAAAAEAIGAVSLTDTPGFPAGPLSGISAALEWGVSEGATFVMIAPCDTPLLTGDVMSQLRTAASAGASVVCAETADGLQPLVSIWRSDLASWLRRELAGGHPSVRDVLARAGFERVRLEAPDVFLNVNTPEDLRRAEVMLHARR
jgi:molybdopterin-guanine dinucleotide biosynthesis protein A